MRACEKSLDAWAGAIGADKVAAHLTTALAMPKASEAAKIAGLAWLAVEAVRAAEIQVSSPASLQTTPDASDQANVTPADHALLRGVIAGRAAGGGRLLSTPCVSQASVKRQRMSVQQGQHCLHRSSLEVLQPPAFATSNHPASHGGRVHFEPKLNALCLFTARRCW